MGLNEWPSECCQVRVTALVANGLDCSIQEVALVAEGFR